MKARDKWEASCKAAQWSDARCGTWRKVADLKYAWLADQLFNGALLLSPKRAFSCVLNVEWMYWPEELEGDAEVISEVEVLLHVDHVVEVVFVFPLYHIQDLELYQSLVMKPVSSLSHTETH